MNDSIETFTRLRSSSVDDLRERVQYQLTKGSVPLASKISVSVETLATMFVMIEAK